jgi:dipeptidyl aminopeptidase/acylaminoacyl peptidase
VLAAALVWTLRTPAKLASAGFRTTAQFSYGQGLDVNATFSADGKLVAYASDRSGSFEIYVRALDPSARELQLTSNGNQNLFPSFSPDGQFVVFSSMKTPGLFRVPALGGSIRRLTDFGTHPSWSPDGRQIVFASHARSSLSTTDYYWAADSTLWLVPAEGGTPRQITSRSNPEGGQTFPSWSADGKQIRFVNYGAGKASIWTYRLSDGVLEHRFSRDKGDDFGKRDLFSRRSNPVLCQFQSEWRHRNLAAEFESAYAQAGVGTGAGLPSRTRRAARPFAVAGWKTRGLQRGAVVQSSADPANERPSGVGRAVFGHACHQLSLRAS